MNLIQYRTISLGKPDPETRTVSASLSSETPVPIQPGLSEILDHGPGSIDLSRAKDGLPLLFCHKLDQPIGIVENIRIEGRRLRGELRFGESAQAREVFADIQSGVLKFLSIGYQRNQSKMEGQDIIRATNWALYECSVVGVPADASVGIGRSFTSLGQTTMSLENTTQQTTQTATHADPELLRIKEIGAMCRDFKVDRELEAQWIESRTPATEALAFIRGMRSIESTRSEFVDASDPRYNFVHTDRLIGLTEREARNFSIVKAINAASSSDWRKAGFERQCSDALAKALGKQTPNGFFVPAEALQVRAPYSTAASGTGGALVPTNLLADSFIDILRKKTQVRNMGAQYLPGLTGNVDIPRRTATTASYWVSGDNADLTEAEGAFDKISLTPKTLGCLSQYSRNMLLQASPAIEELLRNDLANVLAVGIDLAAIAGTGSGSQPRGVLNTSGIGSVVGGTNGAALTIDHLIDLAAAVENANGNGPNCGFLINAASLKALSKLKSTQGEYLWSRGTESPSRAAIAGAPDENGAFSILGYRAAVTNQLRSSLTKGTANGTCSELIFGNWSDLVIGEWGVLEIVVNPYGTGFAAGSVQIRAMQTIDIGIRNAASFAAMSDAVTS